MIQNFVAFLYGINQSLCYLNHQLIKVSLCTLGDMCIFLLLHFILGGLYLRPREDLQLSI